MQLERHELLLIKGSRSYYIATVAAVRMQQQNSRRVYTAADCFSQRQYAAADCFIICRFSSRLFFATADCFIATIAAVRIQQQTVFRNGSMQQQTVL